MDSGIISLRFNHPVRELRFLSEVLGLTPFRTWAVGEPKRTLKGDIIQGAPAGTYKDSYWVARIGFAPGDGFGAELNRILDLLKGAEAAVRDHVASGGAIEIHLNLTGWTHNSGVIPATLLATMADLELTLVVEVFPN